MSAVWKSVIYSMEVVHHNNISGVVCGCVTVKRFEVGNAGSYMTDDFS
jgi:hypothetical protein